MHRLVLAGAAIGALVLLTRHTAPPRAIYASRGGLGNIPNTQSTYDARTKPGLYRMAPPALSDPQWMAFDARLYPGAIAR